VLPLDEEGTEGIKEWFGADGTRPVLSLGPQLPASYLHPKISNASEASSVSSPEMQYSYVHAQADASKEVDPSIAFLDEPLVKYGANSALYISFGTFFVPQSVHVGYLIEVLLELEEPMPFLFAAASPALDIPEGLRQKIATSGRGLVVPWAPQQSVFVHLATGWVTSHCGAGGTSEAITEGVPLIAWPVIADQPQDARWLSEVLDMAFELLQVRCGLGQKKAFRGGPNGTEIIGTEEAIKSEMRNVLMMCRITIPHRKILSCRSVTPQR